MRVVTSVFFVLLTLVIGVSCNLLDRPEIKIGLNSELTGVMPAIGASSKNAASLFVDQINEAGGLDIGDKKLPLRLIVGDNEVKPNQAAFIAQKLIAQDRVLVMVGPNVSSCAIPASVIAEKLRCLMISPWSTNPKTTKTDTEKSKRYVFRTCFTDTFEASALAKFALNDLKVKRVAVLYDVVFESPQSQALLFRDAFEKGGGTITAFETYDTGDRDFSTQLTRIRDSQPDLIFLPGYYHDVAVIAKEARQLGLNQQFLGSDNWSTPEIITLAGEAVEGSYFCNHYSTQIPTPVARKFMSDYTAKFGREPDDVAALTYDTFQLLAHAIQIAGKLDRKAIRNAFSKIRNYKGVTGSIQFEPGSGDPIKSAVILRIENGKFVWVSDANP